MYNTMVLSEERTAQLWWVEGIAIERGEGENEKAR
jgi:hypothetical protein